MNWPYIHTLVNHFPIICTVVGCFALVPAFATGRRTPWLYALITLTIAGVTVYPAHLSGDQAAHALHGVWYIVPAAVREHDESASYALISILAMGAASAYAWWWMARRDSSGLPPVWLRAAVAFLAIFGLSVITRTALLGGRIVHESPRLETAPPGMTPPPDTGRAGV